MYLFPRAVLKYHDLGGFKQQKFIPSHFWRPKVSFIGLQPRCQRGCVCSLRTLVENPFPAPSSFWWQPGFPGWWLHLSDLFFLRLHMAFSSVSVCVCVCVCVREREREREGAREREGEKSLSAYKDTCNGI